jgi:very-short-patch-repair endonuclease
VASWLGFARALDDASFAEQRLLLALALVAEEWEPLERDHAVARFGAGILVHVQLEVARYRVDLALVAPADPGLRLIVEIDGQRGHASWQQAQNDRRRDRELVARGWAVVRFGASEVIGAPLTVALEVTRILQRRAELVGPGLARAVPRGQMRLRFG